MTTKELDTKDYFPIAKIPQPIALVKDLSSLAKIVYGNLYHHAGKNNRCFPRQETIAKELNISIKSVEKSIDILKRRGFIKAVRPGHPRSLTDHGNTYLLMEHECFTSYKNRQSLSCRDSIPTIGGIDTTVTSSESLNISHENEGLTYTEHNNLISSSSLQSESLQILPSVTEEDYNAISSPCAVPKRRLNRGNEELPTQASPIVRKLSRGVDINLSTVSESVKQLRPLSTYELLLLKQSEEDLTPPTMGGVRGVGTVDAGKNKIPTQALALLEYWNLHSGARKHKLPSPGEAPTNTVKNSAKLIKKLLKGQAFLKNNGSTFTEIVTIANIEEAIDLFFTVVTDPDVFPAKKDYVSSMGFPQFIYDHYTGSSYFLKCFNKEVLSTNTMIFKDDLTKEVFEEMKKSYDTYFKREKDFTIYDLRKIRTGADLLIAKLNEIVDRVTIFNLHRTLDDADLWTDWVMESLIDHFGKSVSIGNLSSRYTYDVCLIRYLEKKGRLKTQIERDVEYNVYDEEEVREYHMVDPSEFVGQPIQQEEY